MIKKIYVLAWFLLLASVLAAVFTGTFDPLAMVVFSLVAVGLVYAFALWSVIVNTRICAGLKPSSGRCRSGLPSSEFGRGMNGIFARGCSEKFWRILCLSVCVSSKIVSHYKWRNFYQIKLHTGLIT